MTHTIQLGKANLTVSTAEVKVATVHLTPAVLKQLDYVSHVDVEFLESVELIGRFASHLLNAAMSGRDLVLCRVKDSTSVTQFPRYVVWNPHNHLGELECLKVLDRLPKLILTR